jgi:hypothetical protein
MQCQNQLIYIRMLRHLYYFCSRYDVSFNQRSKLMTKNKNVLLNKLKDAMNSSMSIKRGEKGHNVLSINKVSKQYDVTSILFLVSAG